jgi:hypothetical protein
MTIKLIATATVTTSGVSFISFSSIPQNFTDLVLLVSGRYVTNNPDFILGINGGSSNQSFRRFYGSGSGVASDLPSFIGLFINPSGATANTFGNSSIYVANYNSSNNKSVSIDSVNETNGTAALHGIGAGLYSSSLPITQLSVGGYEFGLNSTASLYGITKGSDGIVTTS